MNTKTIVSALLAEKQEHQNAIKDIDTALTALRGFVRHRYHDVEAAPKLEAKKAAARVKKPRYVERGLVPAALENVLSAGPMEFGEAVELTRKHLLNENHARIPVRKIKGSIWRHLALGRMTRDGDTLTLIKA